MFAEKVNSAREALFETRLKQYGAMSLAIAGAAIAPQAQGSTIFWSGHGETGSTSPLYFNFFTGAVGKTGVPAMGAFAIGGQTDGHSILQPSAAAIYGTTRRRGSKGIYARNLSRSAIRLAVGDRVRPLTNTIGLQFAATGVLACEPGCLTTGQFVPPPAQTGYVGVEFGGPGGEYYGWVNLTVNDDY